MLNAYVCEAWRKPTPRSDLGGTDVGRTRRHAENEEACEISKGTNEFQKLQRLQRLQSETAGSPCTSQSSCIGKGLGEGLQRQRLAQAVDEIKGDLGQPESGAVKVAKQENSVQRLSGLIFEAWACLYLKIERLGFQSRRRGRPEVRAARQPREGREMEVATSE